jgi:hypothetical protein
MDLYIHSSIRLHGVMLNSFSTEITLPFTFYTTQSCHLRPGTAFSAFCSFPLRAVICKIGIAVTQRLFHGILS